MSGMLLRFAIRTVLRLWFDGTDRDAAPAMQLLVDATDGPVSLPCGRYKFHSRVRWREFDEECDR